MRIDELINLKREDVHLDEGWIHVSKSKTAAGIRDIPIPDRLIPFLKCYLDSPYYGKGTTYFYNEWYKTPCLNGHTRHECRHTYITKMTSAGVDQRLIKAIVGHAGTITENVYTHFSIQKCERPLTLFSVSICPLNLTQMQKHIMNCKHDLLVVC